MNQTDKNLQKWHHAAMEKSEDAFFLRRADRHEEAKQKFAEALVLERQAAMALKYDNDCEPTRSVLFRSAAYLAIDAGQPKEAIELAKEGLVFAKGEMAEELRSTIKDAEEILQKEK